MGEDMFQDRADGPEQRKAKAKSNVSLEKLKHTENQSSPLSAIEPLLKSNYDRANDATKQKVSAEIVAKLGLPDGMSVRVQANQETHSAIYKGGMGVNGYARNAEHVKGVIANRETGVIADFDMPYRQSGKNVAYFVERVPLDSSTSKGVVKAVVNTFGHKESRGEVGLDSPDRQEPNAVLVTKPNAKGEFYAVSSPSDASSSGYTAQVMKFSASGDIVAQSQVQVAKGQSQLTAKVGGDTLEFGLNRNGEGISPKLNGAALGRFDIR